MSYRVKTSQAVGFALLLVLSVGAPKLVLADKLDIDQFTNDENILQLQIRMQVGDISAQQLTQYYLDRIDRYDSQYHSIIAINTEALVEARLRDEERAAGKIRGVLHGIPIVIKDNIEVGGMATTAGSLALKDFVPQGDAPLVQNLKAAGAIILAKTNLSEWANFRSERSSSGWSAVGGQTRNPVDITRSACGSSAGTAAAVFANLAVAGVGTETDGSITCPAAATGIVGLKPTVGLVSRTGIVPISHNQDTAGPMTKSVTDAAIMLRAMQGEDPSDPATLVAGFAFDKRYLEKRETNSLDGIRIGLLKSRVKPHEGVEAVYSQTLEQLTAAGAVLIEGLSNDRYEGMGADMYNVLLFEFKVNLNKYLQGLPVPFNKLTLEKLIAFNLEHAETEMPFFQQEIFDKAQAKGPLTDEDYLAALTRLQQATRSGGLEKLYAEHNLDLLITPSLGPAWSIDLINGGKYTGGYSSYSAVSGYPYMTIPMGKLHHLPLGVSLIGLKHGEAEILQYGLILESIFSATAGK